MKKIIALVMTAALLLTALVGCSKGSSGGTVSTDGSTSMEKVIGALGEAFEALQDGVTFTYIPPAPARASPPSPRDAATSAFPAAP